MQKPRRIVESLQDELNTAIAMINPDYRGRAYIVNQRKGVFSYRRGFLTIPLWAYKRGIDYFLYYVSHELSHENVFGGGHCKQFYDNFKRICPIWCQHFEYEYKPKLSEMYGIAKKE